MTSESFADNRLLCGVTHDLAEELLHFSRHKPWQSGLYSKLLVKANDLRVILIAMDSGAKMKEHHTDGTTTIHVLQGLLRLRLHESAQVLKSGHILTLAPGIKHAVEAGDDAAFLVTISWPTGDKLQSLPHRGYGA
jgi:quercetin dioxygenase-like cupin family protein